MLNLIKPYSPNWKTEYEHLSNFLKNALRAFEIDIQHVGSTAIPGLCAKPILDIDIIVDRKAPVDNIAATLEKIGYVGKGEQGIQGRFAFRQRSENTPHTTDSKKWQEHHLYVCYSDSLALKNHLLFRNALLQDKQLLEHYASLKLKLSKEKGMTRENYSTQKTEFILSVLTTLGLEKNEADAIRQANK